MSEAHPISCGRYSHGRPVFNTKMIPVKQARSGIRGRPPRHFARRSAGDSSKVVLVTTSTTCDKVGAGINTALKTPNLARKLYVFSVGTSFAAQDLDHPAGEWNSLIVVNSQFVAKGAVLSP